MKQDLKIQGLSKLGHYLQQFLQKSEIDYTHDEQELAALMRRSEVENPWFTQENIRFCFKNWADILTEENIKNWVSEYQVSQLSKKVGLILAGNIPLVGFHDVMCVILSNHIPLIKLSSKDRLLLPFFLKKWGEFSEWNLEFHKLADCDAFVYLYKGHPLAKKKSITYEELLPYPNMTFDQGDNPSMYTAEEILVENEFQSTLLLLFLLSSIFTT